MRGKNIAEFCLAIEIFIAIDLWNMLLDRTSFELHVSKFTVE